MHSHGKGISASSLPCKRTPPSWLKISAPDAEDNICKFTKKGLTLSQIGAILRDSHEISQVKSVTGSNILRILKAHGLAPEILEDLYHLIKKAVAIRNHLKRNRKEKDSKVPDYHLVTYMVVMPKYMVGGIRRSLETSQSCHFFCEFAEIPESVVYFFAMQERSDTHSPEKIALGPA